MARKTSPGWDMFDKSIFGFCSAAAAREGAFDAAFPPRPRAARTRRASSSSTELECVFFSVTPTSGRMSRITLLFTSSSLAKSLIRTLLIRLFRLFRYLLAAHMVPRDLQSGAIFSHYPLKTASKLLIFALPSLFSGRNQGFSFSSHVSNAGSRGSIASTETG